MQLRSSASCNGSKIPRRFTCDGENLSPPLAWSGAPRGTRSFVLLCDDPDAAGGTWHRSAVCNIPATQTMLAAGAAQRTEIEGVKQAIGDFHSVGYGGPCPPHQHGPHHYQFQVFALCVASLTPRRQPTCREAEREARKHSLAEATLVGLYQR